MAVWVTSDQHYGHEKLAFYRGFSSIDQMDECLISNHNARVQPEEVVYFLGDFAMYKAEGIERILQRLNGKKFLIYGNHDYHLRKNRELQQYFVKCLDYYELKLGDAKVCMSHFPMMAWNRHHYGSVMLHGHCHGSLQYPFVGRIKDVGADCNAYAPVCVEDIVVEMQSIIPHRIDHHVPRKKDAQIESA